MTCGLILALSPGVLPLHDGVVYGPIQSRRLGVSLGINVLPPGVKLCSFNCPYCQYGWTTVRDASGIAPDRWPSAAAIETAVRQFLEADPPRAARIDRLTLAGHGEPTLHPDFEHVVNRLHTLRNIRAPGRPLAILSNSSTVGDLTVRRALAVLDERYMKLDAGDEPMLKRMNLTRLPLDVMLDGLRALPDVVIQTMFAATMDGRVDNASEQSVASWLRAVRTVRPRQVQIYTLDREPVSRVWRTIPAARLNAIGALVRQSGIPAVVFASCSGDRLPEPGHEHAMTRRAAGNPAAGASAQAAEPPQIERHADCWLLSQAGTRSRPADGVDNNG